MLNFFPFGLSGECVCRGISSTVRTCAASPPVLPTAYAPEAAPAHTNVPAAKSSHFVPGHLADGSVSDSVKYRSPASYGHKTDLPPPL